VSAEGSRLPTLLTLYQQYLSHQESSCFVREASSLYTPGTLERLARHHCREVRRAAVLALGYLGDYEANHTLGRALHDDDRTVRMIAENSIRNVWTRVGNESDRRELAKLVSLNAAQRYVEAIARATKLIERAPWIAEAWHQRAVAQALVGHLTESVRDCHQTLEINPYHFVAATSMGQAYLQLGNVVSALECFRRALRLNPALEGIRAQVVRLARMVEGNR
jgi:tetratricopeptide (TPR) repeat protein